MPATGIEPVLCCHNRILSPARLPVPPRRHVNNNGQRRIRTFEGSASRFTVCPLWPLGNLPIKADERTRTVNLLITNQLLCQLSHIGILLCIYNWLKPSDSDGNRTRVTAVKGRCLNRLTTEPKLFW